MYTSAVLFAAFGFLPITPPAELPSWSTDYWASQRQSSKIGKPMAIFLGTGKQGWKSVAKGGKISAEANKLLAQKYVCVFVDVSTKAGKSLAQKMRITTSAGIIISDKTGGYQAFRHQGDLTEAKLFAYLNRYSDPNRVMIRTESNPDRESTQSTTSNRPYTPSSTPQNSGYTPSYQPARFFGGGFCPS